MARQLKVPFGELGDMSKKQPIAINLCRLSATISQKPMLTTTYEQATRGGDVLLKSRVLPPVPGTPEAKSLTRPIGHIVHDDAFGKWESQPLPDGLTLDQVLARVVSVNSFCAEDPKNLLLKIKVRFSDASEITFIRTDVKNPSSLKYDSFYNPNAAFDAMTHGGGGMKLTKDGQLSGLSSASAAFVKKGANAPRSDKFDLVKTFPSKAQMHALFDRLDPNGNRLLSLAELDLAVMTLWPTFNNKPAIMRAYKAADSDGSGLVSRAEFPAFLKYLVNYNTLYASFEASDKAKDRRLTFEEFKAAMKQYEPGKSDMELRQIFDKTDRSKVGVISFDEFASVVAESRSNVIIPTNITLSLPRLSQSQSRSASQRSTHQSPSAPLRSLAVPTGDKLKELFQRCDPNGNGMLSLAELDKAVLEMWPTFNNKPAIMRAYKAADKNRTGFVSKGEFPYFMHYLVHFTNLWVSFATSDKSGDRRVSLQEFLAAAPSFGIKSEAEARSTFAAMDTNHGGYVLFEEFADFMAHTRAEYATSKFDGRSSKGASQKQSKGGSSSAAPPSGPRLGADEKIPIPSNSSIKELFNRLDPNANGKLSLAELDKGVVELWPNFNNKAAIMRAYKATDKDGNGFVTRVEFPFTCSSSRTTPTSGTPSRPPTPTVTAASRSRSLSQGPASSG